VKARAMATASVEIRVFMAFSLYAYNTAELQPEENARVSARVPPLNVKPGSGANLPGSRSLRDASAVPCSTAPTVQRGLLTKFSKTEKLGQAA
jgi:hypothetical protein